MNVAVFGATGFVGGYLVDALTAAGHEPSVLVRPGSRGKLRAPERCRVTTGALGDAGAIRSTLEGCTAAIYNVGLLREFPRRGITFETAHVEGVRQTAGLAREAGIGRYLLMSANGVDAGRTAYQDSKRRGERVLEDLPLAYTILRPSVIFGDPRGTLEFATQLYRDLVDTPFPAAGFRQSSAEPMMSPVHVEDVAAAFVAALADETTHGRTIALGGPEVVSWSGIIERIAAAAERRKRILPVPIGPVRLVAAALDWLPFFPVTRDQLTMLAAGNTSPPDALAALIGRAPRPFSVENLAYLRPGGDRYDSR